MSMSERRHKYSLNAQFFLALLFAHLFATLFAMPTARNIFREFATRNHDDHAQPARRLGGEGGAWRPGAVPGRRINPDEDKVIRYFKLISRCSQKHVRVTTKHVDAKAITDNIYSQLRFVSEEKFGSRLRIQSAHSHTYLCFNKKGKLIVKHSGKDGGCVFQERLSSDHFTEFQSTVNETWYLAFRKNGQQMDGGQWQRRPDLRRCRQFIKTNFSLHEANRSPFSSAKRHLSNRVHQRRHHATEYQLNDHQHTSHASQKSKAAHRKPSHDRKTTTANPPVGNVHKAEVEYETPTGEFHETAAT